LRGLSIYGVKYDDMTNIFSYAVDFAQNSRFGANKNVDPLLKTHLNRILYEEEMENCCMMTVQESMSYLETARP
jgi:hypothetical protein